MVRRCTTKNVHRLEFLLWQCGLELLEREWHAIELVATTTLSFDMAGDVER